MNSREEVLKKILGVYYEPLKDFYKKVLFELNTIRPTARKPYYVVFLSESSYNLANLFFSIIWEELYNNKDVNPLDIPDTICLYKSSMETLLELLVEKKEEYNLGEYKGITLYSTVPINFVDNMIGYGRTVLNTQDGVAVWKPLKNREKFDEFFNLDKINKWINKLIYTKLDQANIIPLDYRQKLTVTKVFNNCRYYDLSMRIAETLCNTGTVNNNYTITMGINTIPNMPSNHYNGWTMIDTEYREHKERCFLYNIDNKIIITIRCIPCVGENYQYKLVPFILFPPLSEEKDLSIIKEYITKKLNIPKFNSLKKTYEFIKTYLGICSIKNLLDTLEIAYPEINAFDIDKVLWNYQLEFTNKTKDILTTICIDKDNLMSFDEISSMLKKTNFNISGIITGRENQTGLSLEVQQKLIKKLEHDIGMHAIYGDRDAYANISSVLSSRIGVRLELYKEQFIDFYECLKEYIINTNYSLYDVISMILNMVDTEGMSIDTIIKGRDKYNKNIIDTEELSIDKKNTSNIFISQQLHHSNQDLSFILRHYYTHFNVLKSILRGYENSMDMEPVISRLLNDYVEELDDSEYNKNLAKELLECWKILIGAPRLVHNYDIMLNRHFVIKNDNGINTLVFNEKKQLELFKKQDINYETFSRSLAKAKNKIKRR